MSEWKVENIATLANGKKTNDISTDATYPIYGGNGIMGYSDSYNASNVIIIGRVGAYCGSVHYSRGKCWISDNAISAKTKEDNNIEYLYYLLSSLNLNRHHIGGAQPLMTQGIINIIDIPKHSLSEQKKIAAILSSLDEKIETNRKINARLEELAQALFKSWFIDFEPFGGKMPEDWKIVKMSDIIMDIAAGPFGSKLPKSCFTLEGTPIIDGANLKERIVDESFSKFVTTSKSKELWRSVAHKGDFVVTISGNIGQIAYIYGTSDFSEFLVSQRQFRFSLKEDKANIFYISLLFANDLGKQKILSFGNQVGVPALSQPLKNFKNIDIMLPNIFVQNKFGKVIASIDSLICSNKQEITRLAELRDALLPKLMSGELKPE